MASLDNRITQLEQRANPEALGMPYTFIVLKAGEKPEESMGYRTVIFEVIQPSTTPGGAHATQPKQQP